MVGEREEKAFGGKKVSSQGEKKKTNILTCLNMRHH